MPRLLMRALLALTLALPFSTFAEETATEPSPEALTFALGFSDDQLSGMLSKIGARQPPLMALGQMDGATLAAVFDAEIARAVSKYGADWQRNMALAWMPLMSDDELASLTTAGAQSPHVDKYLELRGQAGARMQELSGELFQKILEEVIGKTISELGAAPAEEPAKQ